MESNENKQPEDDNKDIFRAPTFTKEQADKVKSNPDFQGYAYYQLLEVLLKESSSDSNTLAEARVYARMLKQDKKANTPSPRSIS